MDIRQTHPNVFASRSPWHFRSLIPCFCAFSVVLLINCVAAADDVKAPTLPSQQFVALPGKVIGVLANTSQALLAGENRKGPADALTLSSGLESPLWVYLPNQKKALIGAMNFPVGRNGSQLKRFDHLSLATAQRVESAGITKPFTLVEVEVNGGLGSSPAQLFVATSIRPVEGTKRFPLEVTSVVERLNQHFRKWQSAQSQTLESAIGTERHKLGWAPRKETQKLDDQLQYVTWLPDRLTLHVQIRERRRELDPLHKPSKPPRAYDGEDGAPPDRKATRTIEADRGLAYEVNREGTIEHITIIPLHSFHTTPVSAISNRQVTSR